MGFVNFFLKKRKNILTFGRKYVKYTRTAYMPYLEWWRERPDETRQPV